MRTPVWWNSGFLNWFFDTSDYSGRNRAIREEGGLGMAIDRNGDEIRAGDLVMVPCVVRHVHYDDLKGKDDGFELSLSPAGDLKGLHVHMAARNVELVESLQERVDEVFSRSEEAETNIEIVVNDSRDWRNVEIERNHYVGLDREDHGVEPVTEWQIPDPPIYGRSTARSTLAALLALSALTDRALARIPAISPIPPILGDGFEIQR